MGRFKKPVSYILFILAATYLFLYLTFPSHIVRQYVLEFAEQRFPSVSLSIARLEPTLTGGIRLENIQCAKNRNPSFYLFDADDIVIGPSAKMVVTGKPAIGFDCRAYGGRINGVTIFDRFSLGPPFRTDIDMKDLKVERYAALKEALGRDCFGALDATFSYTLANDYPSEGSGKGIFSIHNGSIRFTEPFLGLSEFDFNKIEGAMELRDQKIFVNRISFQGPQITGAGTGTVFLNRAFRRSGLDFSVDIKPVPEFLKANKRLAEAARFFLKGSNIAQFTLKIQGTVARPRVNFR